MTQLLEIKDKIIKFYSRYETYLGMVIRFAVALAIFLIINSNIGYMEKISTLPVALILALVCCILPANAIIWFAAVLVLLDMYALSLEVAVTTLIVFAVIYFIYFRFAPKDGIAAVLTPICFKFNIPFVMPIGCGLLRPAYSVISVVCGTAVYYYLEGIRQNASTLISVSADDEAGSVSKFSVSIGLILNNKEMFLVIAFFVITCLVVYFVRKISIDHAWTVAIVAGTLVQFSGLLAGYLIMNISGKTILLILGSIISMLIGFVIEFFFMDLDYARTERVQFEDDDYYYYVKAVPKKMVASQEKTVKHFGNTASIGKRIDRNKANTSINNEEVSRKVIARELDIDEDLLK